MRHKIGGLGLVCIACVLQCALLDGAEPWQGEVKQPWIPDIQVEKYTLKNGLTVILHEDHKARMVAVNVTYNVGSKDDAPGRSGFAHLFEHMMFEGSEHHDPGFSGPIYRYMIDGRAETDRDHTVYYDTVTSNALERVLWLEADRMGFVLPAITPAKLRSVRSVVKNERRQSHDNVPLGGLWDRQMCSHVFFFAIPTHTGGRSWVRSRRFGRSRVKTSLLSTAETSCLRTPHSLSWVTWLRM
jgi:zinc protease